MTKDEALKLAFEALKWSKPREGAEITHSEAIAALEEVLAQPAQDSVVYDKTEINCFAQDLYHQKMREGKHGHYESMFHVIHQCIKKAAPPQRKPLTEEDMVACPNPAYTCGDYCQNPVCIKGRDDLANYLNGWNAALDEVAEKIGEIKGFGKTTQDSFAVYIKGFKK